MTQQLSTNTFGCAKWIVSADATQGTHTSISAALSSASSGDTIFIRPGTYTENPPLKAGVNLAAYSSDGFTPNVTIQGNCSYSSAGTVTITGINLRTNGTACLTVSGASASIVNLINCFITCANATGISYSTANSSSILNIVYCQGNIGTPGVSFFAMSSTGMLEIRYCNITNTGSSTAASTVSAGFFVTTSSILTFPISSSSTSSVTIGNASFISTANMNVIGLTIGGSGSNTVALASFLSGTASAISVSSGAALGITLSSIGSTNTNPVTGLGSVTFNGVSFISSGRLTNTTTQSGGAISGISGVVAPASGFIGEQIRSFVPSASAVSLAASSVPTNITSISVTPGIWDISCVGILNVNSATISNSILSMSTTSATLGTEGDNYVYMFIGSAGLSDGSGSIASWRQTFSTTTIVYLVMSAGFSVATPRGFGRISATRVG